MALFNLSEIIGTLKDNVSKALKVKGEVELTGSYVEYRGLSTDTKPAGERVGETYFEIDTANVYMWDGSHWRLI